MKSVKSAAHTIDQIQSGQSVFIHGGSATPTVLIEELIKQADRLRDVELIHMHTEFETKYSDPIYKNSFRVTSLFVGANLRCKLDMSQVDYLPCFLSEIPDLFRSKRKAIDVAMLHLSPPDSHGFCTLGTSVDVALAAFQSAKVVVAQINKQMPRVHGDTFIHIDDLDSAIEVDLPLYEPSSRQPSSIEATIGNFVASIVEDGACLQVGIGAVPDAVLQALNGHRNLGVHTEMWSDGILKLIQSGSIDNSKKAVHPNKCVSSFIIGSKAVYDFINDNPSVIQLGADYVNNPNIISRNSKVTAINSAVEIDLTGQVCADSIGHQIISGVGGQMDFIRGASLSSGGKPIIAMTSRTKKGTSRIVPTLKAGAGVVTTRAHVHFIVTEYGIADLYGKTLGERAKALIAISHPQDKEWLDREWSEIQRQLQPK